jgi:hypothetical protein
MHLEPFVDHGVGQQFGLFAVTAYHFSRAFNVLRMNGYDPLVPFDPGADRIAYSPVLHSDMIALSLELGNLRKGGDARSGSPFRQAAKTASAADSSNNRAKNTRRHPTILSARVSWNRGFATAASSAGLLLKKQSLAVVGGAFRRMRRYDALRGLEASAGRLTA